MRLFGTDGIRGLAGEFPLDSVSVRLLGRELARRLSERGSRRRVVLGGDTRESTPRIVADLAAGLREGGCGVAAAGIITTPGIAELVLELGAAAGIAVSASHNPYQDNGIKIFGADGRKWPDEEEEYWRSSTAGTPRAGHDSSPAGPRSRADGDLRVPAQGRAGRPRRPSRPHGRRQWGGVPDRARAFHAPARG